MSNCLLVLVSTSVALLGITLPYIYKLFGGEPPASTLEMSSLLVVIWTLVAIFAGGAYGILSRQLQVESRQVAESAGEEIRGRTGRSYAMTGEAFWEMYLSSKKRKKDYLNFAILFTEIAYRETEIAKKDPRFQIVICDIMNNLAYFYAERERSEDRNKAQAFAEYIKNKIKEFPKEGEEWLNTCEFVKKRYQP